MRLFRIVVGAFLAAMAFGAATAQAASITLASTGAGAPGTVDANYELIQAPPGVDLEAVIIDPTKLADPWASPLAGANWIGVTDDDARTAYPVPSMAPSDPGHLDLGGGLYVFRMSFDLTGFVASSMVINGFWAADNLAEIEVNGVATGVTTVGYGLSAFALDSGNATFVDGINAVDFRVTNLLYQADIGNPVGLLVQGLEASAVEQIVDVEIVEIPEVPEPSSLLLLGTGLLFAGQRIRRRRAR